jgi:hypothetical protein
MNSAWKTGVNTQARRLVGRRPAVRGPGRGRRGRRMGAAADRGSARHGAGRRDDCRERDDRQQRQPRPSRGGRVSIRARLPGPGHSRCRPTERSGRSRLAPIQDPRMSPYFSIACSVYREHDGS